MPFNPDWDKDIVASIAKLQEKADKLGSVFGEDNDLVKDLRGAIAELIASTESKLTTLRDQRDDLEEECDALKKRLSELKGNNSGSPSKPTKRTTFRADPKALLPAAHSTLFARAEPWLESVRDVPMRNIRNGKRAINRELDFDIFDHRWIDSFYTFPLQAKIRAYGLEQPVKDIAALYLAYLPRFKSFGTLPLEWCIASGVIAGDLMVMLDNPHIPECVKAEKAMRQKLAEFKAFMKEQTGRKYPGKPYWWHTQNFPHPLISYTLYLWVDHQMTGDKESLEGFLHIGQQLTGSFVYGKTKSGIELVNMPHRIHARQRDIQPSYSKTKGGAFDATYIETLASAAIKHFWNGTGLIDERFLAALGHTVMLTSGPDGFSTFGKTASEAFCGAVKAGSKSRDGEEVLVLNGGAETVRTPNVVANRTTTRMNSVSQIRGAWGATTPFAVKKNPEMAKQYHKNLDDACKQQARAQAPALWKAFSEAQPKGYLEGK